MHTLNQVAPDGTTFADVKQDAELDVVPRGIVAAHDSLAAHQGKTTHGIYSHIVVADVIAGVHPMDAILGVVEMVADSLRRIGVFKIKTVANVLDLVIDEFGVLDVVEKDPVTAIQDMPARVTRDFTVPNLQIVQSIGTDAETRTGKLEIR